MKKCEYCNTEILAGERSCPNCGATAFYTATEPESTSSEPEKISTGKKSEPVQKPELKLKAKPKAKPQSVAKHNPRSAKQLGAKLKQVFSRLRQRKEKPQEDNRQKPVKKRHEFLHETKRIAIFLAVSVGVLIMVFVMIAESEVRMYQTTMDISRKEAVAIMDTMKACGVNHISSLKQANIYSSKDHYYASTSHGNISITLVRKKVYTIKALNIPDPLYSESEVKLKVLFESKYKNQAIIIIHELLGDDIHITQNDLLWTIWTDFEFTYLEGKFSAKYQSTLYPFSVTFDAEGNPVSVLVNGVECIDAI